jgi:3-hydroxyacyl-[acyl-carrier-protein] dehydratase
MLLNELFTIREHVSGSETMSAVISIDPDHRIFGGHFPGMPVMPGVCMLQMIKDVFESARKTRYRITDARSIKFLAVLNPAEQSTVDALIRYTEDPSGGIHLEGSLSSDSVVYFKLIAALRPA